MRQAVDEADETWHWMEVLRGNETAIGREAEWLLQESIELRAIFSKSVSTAKANQKDSRI
jgi:hypothetical protein